MLAPVNFTGIKNIGYTKVYTTDNRNLQHRRYMLNMEMTNDANGKDLSIYRQLTGHYPELKNEVNANFLNIEFDCCNVDNLLLVNTKMNGVPIPRVNENSMFIKFIDNIIHRVAKFKEKDFELDESHPLMKEAYQGLIYKEDMDDYFDGTSGKLDFILQEYIDDNADGKAETLTDKFNRYFNSEMLKLKEKDRNKVVDAAEYILESLHNPQYVHNGAVYMDALAAGLHTIPYES